jgi:hypothetical protein
VVLPLLSILVGESRLLVSWCAGGRCRMVGSNEDHGKSRRPGAQDRRWSSIGRVLGGRMIERSADVVCDLHRAQGDEERGFGLNLKTKVNGFSQFGHKTSGFGFPGLGLKIGSYGSVI